MLIFFNLQEVGTHQQNMGYLHQALSAVKQKMGDTLMADSKDTKWTSNLEGRQRDTEKNKNISLSTDDLINCITTPEVISAMTVQVLKRYGISQTSDLPLESLPAQAKPTVPLCTDNADRPCSGHGSSQLDDSVKSEQQTSELLIQSSSDEWKIPKHPPCKRMCIDNESNKE